MKFENPNQDTLMESVVSDFEGTLLKDTHPFSYFMLVAFEASGLIRFAILLMAWPIVRLLEMLGKGDASLKLMIFITVVGVREKEIESVGRAVLPKFYMDDIDTEAWRIFNSCDKRVVVTTCPRVMVERFAKEHLHAHVVVGSELKVNGFGFATGFIKDDLSSIANRVEIIFRDGQPMVELRRCTSSASRFLYLCKEQHHLPFVSNQKHGDHQQIRPLPVIFHDGRLVKLPTPYMALLILLWFPLGIILATIRMVTGIIQPMRAIPYTSRILGGDIIVKGNPPAPPSGSKSGVLFVCTHRTLLDPIILSVVLQRKVPAVTYSISRLSEILSPIPTVRLTRRRHVDAEKIKRKLTEGDLVVCPEGTTCREPFLLRFSALFAELTNRILPVAMNYKVGFFHATTARGWKALDPFFFFMNPWPIYEVTFLNQLPIEATCSSGKSPHDVANYVQRILAATLGFECTNFTQRDKFEMLAGNDGTVSYTSYSDQIRNVVTTFKHIPHQVIHSSVFFFLLHLFACS